jgi:hypothetical protein
MGRKCGSYWLGEVGLLTHSQALVLITFLSKVSKNCKCILAYTDFNVSIIRFIKIQSLHAKQCFAYWQAPSNFCNQSALLQGWMSHVLNCVYHWTIETSLCVFKSGKVKCIFVCREAYSVLAIQFSAALSRVHKWIYVIYCKRREAFERNTVGRTDGRTRFGY